MYQQETQRGAWWAVRAAFTDPATRLPLDITGKQVDVVLRVGPGQNDAPVTIDAKQAIIADGTGGVARVGGRVATPSGSGPFYGTIIVGQDSDGANWPVKARFRLLVNDCP